MSDTPRTDEIWWSTQGRGYQTMLLAQKLERKLAELQNAFEDAVTAREQVEQERDKHFAASKAQNADITALQTELAEAKRETMQAIGLAAFNKQEAETHYERAEKAEAELASYKLWAEVEMADLREDLSDHIRMAKDAQEDAGRYRWMKQEVKRIPPDWAEFGWDTCIDIAIKGSAT